MKTILSREHRKTLETTVAQARVQAEAVPPLSFRPTTACGDAAFHRAVHGRLPTRKRPRWLVAKPPPKHKTASSDALPPLRPLAGEGRGEGEVAVTPAPTFSLLAITGRAGNLAEASQKLA